MATMISKTSRTRKTGSERAEFQRAFLKRSKLFAEAEGIGKYARKPIDSVVVSAHIGEPREDLVASGTPLCNVVVTLVIDHANGLEDRAVYFTFDPKTGDLKFKAMDTDLVLTETLVAERAQRLGFTLMRTGQTDDDGVEPQYVLHTPERSFTPDHDGLYKIMNYMTLCERPEK